MLVLVEDFKHLTMSLLSRACVRFKNTEDYYHGYEVKTKYRFEFTKNLRELIFPQDKDGRLWNSMCQRIILVMIMLRHTVK
jgi:hypothetical protein